MLALLCIGATPPRTHSQLVQSQLMPNRSSMDAPAQLVLQLVPNRTASSTNTTLPKLTLTPPKLTLTPVPELVSAVFPLLPALSPWNETTGTVELRLTKYGEHCAAVISRAANKQDPAKHQKLLVAAFVLLAMSIAGKLGMMVRACGHVAPPDAAATATGWTKPLEGLGIRGWRLVVHSATLWRGWPRALLHYLLLTDFFVSMGMIFFYTYGQRDLDATLLDDGHGEDAAEVATHLLIVGAFFCVQVWCLSIVLIFGRMPAEEKALEWKNDPSFIARVGVVIPCHKSADEIGGTIAAVVRHFLPENVVVVDNANQLLPPDNTQAVINEACRDAGKKGQCKYLFVPTGHKTNALANGVAALPAHVEYMLLLDDDTVLPPNFIVDELHFADPRVSSVGFPIRIAKQNFLTQLIDLEMRSLSALKNTDARFGSVFNVFGVNVLWRRAAFVSLLRDHPLLPWGEDGWLSVISAMSNLRQGFESRCWVTTFAPPRLFSWTAWIPGFGGDLGREQGYGAATLWKQRAKRWFTNQTRRIDVYLLLVLFYNVGTLRRSIWFRVQALYQLVRTAGFVLAVIALGALIVAENGDLSSEFREVLGCRLWFGMAWFCWHKLLLAYLWRILYCSTMNLVILPQAHRSSALVIFVFPLYEGFLLMANAYAKFYSLLWYIPWRPMRIGAELVGPVDSAVLGKAEKSNPWFG